MESTYSKKATTSGHQRPPIRPAAKAVTPPKPVEAESEEPSLAQACHAVIRQAASAVLLRNLGHERGLSREKVQDQLWQLDEGRALRDLSRSRYGNMPRNKALAAISTSPDRARWSAALELLRTGIKV